MDKKNAQSMLKAYLAGTCTEEERQLLESWYQSLEGKELPFKGQSERDNQLEEIWANLPVHQQPKTPFVSFYMVAAAVILLCCITGLYFHSVTNTFPSKTHQVTTNDIPPGTNKATLTLADGSKISLSDADKGKIATENGIIISKTSDGQLHYQAKANTSRNGIAIYNTLETPIGGQYMIVLPDSTRVWLNAASILKYPSDFSNQQQRQVELRGEAYFEVAKNKRKPFIVKTASQEVKVLGTHFNINSYTDEPNVQTTLLEGSVIVNVLNQKNITTDSVRLKPGQQSKLERGKLTVGIVDRNEASAWKNGLFIFKNADIQTVMRAVGRWYNVEIVYQGTPPERSFSGEIYRNINLKELLEILNFNHVHFRVEGKKILVTS